MPNLFVTSSPAYGQCQGIVLSKHSAKTDPECGYVNGKEEANIRWQFNSDFTEGFQSPRLERQAEENAFDIFWYKLSGTVKNVEKCCVITESINQSVSIYKVVLDVIPQSIFYTAIFQYHIWLSGYLDVEFDGFMGNFNRELVVAAKNRIFKSGDPIRFCTEADPEKCGIAILESEISDTKWNASLYLVDADISLLKGRRLITKKIGGFERERSGENIRSSFEADFALVDQIKSK